MTSLNVQIDPECVLYISENLATLEYKLQEEVMIAVQQLSAIVSTCSHLASILESCQVDGDPGTPLTGKTVKLGEVRPLQRGIPIS